MARWFFIGVNGAIIYWFAWLPPTMVALGAILFIISDKRIMRIVSVALCITGAVLLILQLGMFGAH